MIHLEKKQWNEIINDTIFTAFGYYHGYNTYSLRNKERTPSLYIYYDVNRKMLCYKDFSSGEWGDVINFIIQVILYKKEKIYLPTYIKNILPQSLTYKNVRHALLEHFDTIISNSNGEIKIVDRKIILENRKVSYLYDICSNDKIYEYWGQYYIDRLQLNFHNVLSLCNVKIKDYELEGFRFICGFFDKSGKLKQIYIPKEATHDGQKRFFTIDGSAMICNKVDIKTPKKIIFVGSYKDGIVLSCALEKEKINDTLVISINNEAPKSIDIIYWSDYYKKTPKYLIYDTDEAGINNSVKLCQNVESLNNLTLSLKEDRQLSTEKDISDMIKVYGTEVVVNKLMNLIN